MYFLHFIVISNLYHYPVLLLVGGNKPLVHDFVHFELELVPVTVELRSPQIIEIEFTVEAHSKNFHRLVATQLGWRPF